MDLEKLVNQSFEHERDLPFDETHWENLNRQLDKQQHRKKWFSWWAWLSLLLLLLLLGNWYLQSQTISKLEAHIDQLLAVPPPTITQVDTVWQVDTVIQREAYPVYLTENGGFASATTAVINEEEQEVLLQALAPADPVKIAAEETKPDRKGIFKFSSQQVPALVAKKPVHLHPGPFLNLPEENNVTDFMAPRIGLSYHSGRVSDPEKVSGAGVLEQQFQQVGVQLNARLWQNLSLLLEIGQEWQTYRALDSLPERYGFEAPFQYYTSGFSAYQQSIFYRIGLDYGLASKWRIRPIFGVGILGQSSLLTAAKTQFRSDNPYLMPDERQEKTIRRDALSLNYGYGKIGLETTLYRRWGLQFYGTFYQPLKTLWEFEKQHSWGAQLYYQF